MNFRSRWDLFESGHALRFSAGIDIAAGVISAGLRSAWGNAVELLAVSALRARGPIELGQALVVAE